MKFSIKDFFSNVTKSTALSYKAIKRYSEKVLLFQITWEKNIFRTVAVDNIDVNLKTSTAFISVYGTAASLNQHLNERNRCLKRIIPKSLPSDKVLNKLLSSYIELLPCHFLSYVEML